METIKFENAPGLGAEVEYVKPFCKLTKKMDIPVWQDIVGDFADKTKPGLAGRKFSRLCGFTFKTKKADAPTKLFQIVFVPKLKGSITRNDKALSGWYCWQVHSEDHRDVTSIADMRRYYNFDVNSFFHTDYFEKYLAVFKSNVSYALANQVAELVKKSGGTNEWRELVRHVRAVKDSLEKIDEVQQFVTPDDKYDDSGAPDYAKGSAPEVGHAKIAYNADKTYRLQNISKKAQRDEMLARAAAQKAAKERVEEPAEPEDDAPEQTPAEPKKKQFVKFDPKLKHHFGGGRTKKSDEKIFDRYDDYDNDDFRQVMMTDMKLTRESILDFPQESLNPSIWNVTDDGSYVLRDEVANTIQKIVDWAQKTFQIPQMNVNITGSNTSNCYSSKSDIDIHFNSPKLKKDKADDFNKLFKKKFEELVSQRPELSEVNGVKIEIYMQANPFQDLMSVGCYDFLNKKWLVGPDFKDMNFDPYAEYFMKDLKSVDDVIDGVRSIILQMYELSLATLKSKDDEFKKQAGGKLVAAMNKAKKTFDALRKRRTHKSSPKDAEEAAKNRDDKDWQVADSAFKLLDKLGYLGMLKVAAQAIENEASPEEAAQSIISAITDKISSKVLDDSEKEFIIQLQEVEMQNESFGSMMKISALAAMMSIGALLPATALAKELKGAKAVATQQGQKFKSNSPAVKDAVKKAAKENTMVGPMTKTNVVNAVAQVLWKEARGEGEAGVKAVASVILNRTGNDPAYLIDVIKMKKQFSCLNDYSGGWTDKTYKWYNPSVASLKDPTNSAMWETCKQISLQLVDKKFKSTIGNRNVYLNPDTADQSAIDSWGKDCDFQVGKHKFGYRAEYDPVKVKPGTFTSWKKIDKGGKFVVVKNGETLSKIAKDNNTTVDKILVLNKSIKDKNKISVGQKIRIA